MTTVAPESLWAGTKVAPITDQPVAEALADAHARYIAATEAHAASKTAVINCVLTLQELGTPFARLRRLDPRAMSGSLAPTDDDTNDPLASEARLIELLDARDMADVLRADALDALCYECALASDASGFSYRQIAQAAGFTQTSRVTAKRPTPEPVGHIYAQQLAVRARRHEVREHPDNTGRLVGHVGPGLWGWQLAAAKAAVRKAARKTP